MFWKIEIKDNIIFNKVRKEYVIEVSVNFIINKCLLFKLWLFYKINKCLFLRWYGIYVDINGDRVYDN